MAGDRRQQRAEREKQRWAAEVAGDRWQLRLWSKPRVGPKARATAATCLPPPHIQFHVK